MTFFKSKKIIFLNLALLFIVSTIVYSVVVVNSTSGFDAGVKVNTSTSTDRYNQSVDTLELDFPYGVKDSSLVVYSRFENNYIDETNQYNGTEVGSVPFVDGKFGKGIDFSSSSGSDYVNYSTDPISDDGDVTFSIWVKPIGTSSYQYVLSSGGQSASTGYAIRFDYATKKVWVMRATTSHYGCVNGGYVPMNEWSMVTGTYNSTSDTTKLYVNGRYIDEVTGTADSKTNAYPDLIIGNANNKVGDSTYDFEGDVDEFKLYNRTLTASEISDLYNQYQPSGLVSYWKFDGDSNDEIGSNDLTGTNASYGAGKFGQGAVFDGSSTRVFTGNAVNTLPKTLNLWFKTSSTAQDAVLVMTGRHNDDSTIEFSIYNTHNDLYFANQHHTVTLHGISSYISTNVWNMVTVEMDSSHNVKVYINGVDKTSNLIDYSYMWNEADNVVVGAREYSGSWSRLFNGTIDEVQIYNRSLTASEVSQLYKNSVKYKWSGSWLSENVSTNSIERVNNISLYYENVDSNTYIDKVELINASDDNVLTTYFGDLNSSNPYELENHSLRSDGNLVSYYRFENNADDELGLNNGTLNGGYSFIDSVNSNFNNGLSLDGTTGYVDLGASGSLDALNGSLTVGAWFNLRGYKWVNSFVEKGNQGTNLDIWLYHYNTSGISYLAFEVGNGSARDSVRYNSYLPDLNKWYFFVGTYNTTDNKLSIYLNGDLLNEKISTIDFINTSTYHTFIGSYKNVAYFLNGSIDDVFILNRTLTPSEISNLYEKNKKVLIATDFNNGFIPTYNITYKIKPYLVSNGSKTPTLESINLENNLKPNISLGNPINNSSPETQVIIFNYTPYDDSGFNNCSLWSNQTGSFNLIQTNTTPIIEGVTNSFTYTFDNTYPNVFWNVQCFDNALESWGTFNESGKIVNIGKGLYINKTSCLNGSVKQTVYYNGDNSTYQITQQTCQFGCYQGACVDLTTKTNFLYPSIISLISLAFLFIFLSKHKNLEGYIPFVLFLLSILFISLPFLVIGVVLQNTLDLLGFIDLMFSFGINNLWFFILTILLFVIIMIKGMWDEIRKEL